MLKKLILLAAIISIMPVAQLVLAQPFGFFGMRSALKNNYLEDVGASFLRMNISMQYIFSADFSNPDYDPYEDVWDYKAVYDDLTTHLWKRCSDGRDPQKSYQRGKDKSQLLPRFYRENRGEI